jgi:hypothetical protein
MNSDRDVVVYPKILLLHTNLVTVSGQLLVRPSSSLDSIQSYTKHFHFETKLTHAYTRRHHRLIFVFVWEKTPVLFVTFIVITITIDLITSIS